MPTSGAPAGTPCDALATAFENAAKTVVIAVAAGNSGEDGYTYPSFNTISSPANAPSVIAVGATTNSHVMGPSVKVLGAGVPSNLVNISALPSDSYFYPSQFGANTAQTGKAEIPRRLGQNQKAEQDTRRVQVRHDEEEHPGLARGAVLVFEAHQPVGQQGHQFPGDQKHPEVAGSIGPGRTAPARARSSTRRGVESSINARYV